MTRAIARFAFASFVLAASAAAQAPQWTRATPFGSPMTALAQAPSSPQTLYAVAWPGRFFASTDGGATWHARAPTLPDETIVDVVADPFDPRTVYARTTAPSLIRSDDVGRFWVRADWGRPGLRVLAADRGQPGVLWAATLEGLYRSADRGETWQAAALPERHLVGLAVDPRTPSTLWAAEATGDFLDGTLTVWRSLDQGVTWESAPLGTEPLSFDRGELRFAFDPARPGTAYAFFAGDSNLGPVFRTGDRGASWTELPAALGVRDLAPLPDGSLLAATDFGTARSLDQGVTWNPPLPLAAVTAPKDALTRMFVSAAEPGTLLAAGAAGIWTSGDGGARWEASNRGMVAQDVFSLVATPVGVPALITSIEGNGVFRSTNRGTTWTRVHAVVEGLQPSAHLTLDPQHPRTLYGIAVNDFDRLLRSTDGGRTWEILPVPYTGSDPQSSVVMSLVAGDPHHPETVFVAGSYFFFHGGGFGNFFLRSDDGFQTFTRLPAYAWNALAGDPATPGVFFGLTGKRLLRSNDGGATWRRIGTGLPSLTARSALAIDPRDPRRIWVGTAGKGVFLSADGGRTFQTTGRGLDAGQIVTTLVIDPQNPDRVYAGTSARGVYRWEAEHRRWTPLNQGLPLTGYTGVLSIDPQHPSTLYAVHPAQGIFRLDLEETEP